MSESPWTTETPTKPGLYFYSAGDGSEVRQYRLWKPYGCVHLAGDFITSSQSQGGAMTLLHTEAGSIPSTGYWQPVTIPDPYVAPKPPELKADEVWEARYKYDSPAKCGRWVFRCGTHYVAYDNEWRSQNAGRWDDVADNNYTLIRRVS